MWIVVIIVVLIFLYALIIYNSLVSKRNKVKQAYSGIDVYLTQRFELIPNLVECVKGYMIYEKELLQEITEKRANYLQNKNLKDAQNLNVEFNKILAIAENYPELKTSEQFLNLQKNLSKMENQLQAARRIYNVEVNSYNNTVQMFPSNIFANMFGFHEEEFFEAEETVRNNVEVNYDENKGINR